MCEWLFSLWLAVFSDNSEQMLILADHHQKLIYTRAHLLPLLALLPQETTTKKVIQLFFKHAKSP